MQRILAAALIILIVAASTVQAGWRHHHQPVYYYAAPAYMPVQGGQSSAQNGPLQDALLQIVAGVIRDRLGQIGGGNGGTTTTPSSQTEIGQLRAEMREMRSDLSLRIENANSILQSQGKKLIENEAA